MKRNVRTEHDVFYWIVFWCIRNHEYYTFSNILPEYWKKVVPLKFPKKGLTIEYTCNTIRKYLLIKSYKQCKKSINPKTILKEIPFHNDTCKEWLKVKDKTIKFK